MAASWVQQIRTGCILPEAVSTEPTSRGLFTAEEAKDRYEAVAGLHARRIGTGTEVAEGVEYLICRMGHRVALEVDGSIGLGPPISNRRLGPTFETNSHDEHCSVSRRPTGQLRCRQTHFRNRCLDLRPNLLRPPPCSHGQPVTNEPRASRTLWRFAFAQRRGRWTPTPRAPAPPRRCLRVARGHPIPILEVPVARQERRYRLTAL